MGPLRYLHHMEIIIKDIKWDIYLQNEKVYIRQHGNDSSGITRKTDRQIFLKIDSLGLGLIRHELAHAYYSSCCTDSVTELHVDDCEEIFAEIIECHLDQIEKNSRLIYNEFKWLLSTKYDILKLRKKYGKTYLQE